MSPYGITRPQWVNTEAVHNLHGCIWWWAPGYYLNQQWLITIHFTLKLLLKKKIIIKIKKKMGEIAFEHLVWEMLLATLIILVSICWFWQICYIGNAKMVVKSMQTWLLFLFYFFLFNCTFLFRHFWPSSIIVPWGLTHWGRVRHICVSKLTIIGSDNGLSPDRRQAIIWTNAGILLIGPLEQISVKS